MGFFSWNCKKCDHSIKSPYNLPAGWEYMNECVVLSRGYTMMEGEYDGYGRVEGEEIMWHLEEPEMWHKKCWSEAGSPIEYTGASDYARDQGFFYDYPEE